MVVEEGREREEEERKEEEEEGGRDVKEQMVGRAWAF